MRLVFIHGFGGGPNDWDLLLHDLNLPSLCLDLQTIPISSDSTWKSFVTDVETRIRSQFSENEKIVLCGYSMGGRVALHLGSAFSSQLEGLILLSTGFGMATETQRVARSSKDREWALLLRQSRADFWRLWYKQEIFSSLGDLPPGLVTQWVHSRARWPTEILALHMERLGSTAHPWALPLLSGEISVPVLYLVGEKDKKYGVLSHEVASCCRRATVEVLAGVGHVLVLEAPKACATAIKTFFKK